MRLKRIIAAAMTAVIALMPAASTAPESVSAADRSVTFSYFDTNINGGETIRGVDVSSIISLENAGVKFYSESGQEQDIFKTLAENGVNYIRVRVWNEPNDGSGHSYGGGNNDVKVAGEIGKRAAKYNMKLLVDIQYSDFWADPGKQTRPKYWQKHDHNTLKGEIYKWTSWVLESITKDGGKIGMVQVGNETNCFFCGTKDMYEICDLFASGNKAVRDFDKSILIAHHFANPNKTDYYKWYAEVMNECKLDYDVFATSYYPYWHGTLDNLTGVLKYIGDTYHKYVMVAETAYPYTNEDGDSFGNAVTSQSPNVDLRYDISVAGQEQCLMDVFQAVADTGKWGLGVFYWEPAWIGTQGDISRDQRYAQWEQYGNGWATSTAREYDKDATEAGGSSYDNQGLFDKNGKPLESLKAFTRVYPQKDNFIPETGVEVDEGFYRIKNAASGLYLTVANGEEKAGANVVQYTADGAAGYNMWRIEAVGDGYYEIRSGFDFHGTYLLDLDAGKKDDRTNIGIYTRTDSDAQKFKFLRGEGDELVIVTKSSGDRSAVEIDGAKTTDGANVQQYRRNGERCQMWILEPVVDPIIYGDLDGDCRVDVYDLVLMRQHVVNGWYHSAADLNLDDTVGVADLVKMERFLLCGERFEKSGAGTPKNTIFPKV